MKSYNRHGALLKVYGALLKVYGVLLKVYGALLKVYGALLKVYWTLFKVCRVLLSVRGALLSVYGALLSGYWALFKVQMTVSTCLNCQQEPADFGRKIEIVEFFGDLLDYNFASSEIMTTGHAYSQRERDSGVC